MTFICPNLSHVILAYKFNVQALSVAKIIQCKKKRKNFANGLLYNPDKVRVYKQKKKQLMWYDRRLKVQWKLIKQVEGHRHRKWHEMIDYSKVTRFRPKDKILDLFTSFLLDVAIVLGIAPLEIDRSHCGLEFLVFVFVFVGPLATLCCLSLIILAQTLAKSANAA